MILEDSDRELVLHRLREPVEDDELRHALERLRLHHWHLWQVVREYREDPSRLEEWQRAEKTFQEWRAGVFFEEALKVLDTALFE